MLKTNFGCGNHKRLAEISQHLSPQNVEVISRSRALGNLEIDGLGGKVIKCSIDSVICLTVDVLQESLHVTGGVFWASAIESMG